MGLGSVLGKIGEVLGFVNKGVKIVEILGGILAVKGTPLEGATKQEIARTFVRQSIVESELFLGKDIVDEDAFDKALNQIIDGVVAAMNAVKA